MRKLFCLTLFLIAIAFAATACQQPSSNNANTNRPANASNVGNTNAAATTTAGVAGVQEALTRLEAALAANDVDALDKLYTNDYRFVAPTGEIITKQQQLDSFRDGSTKAESFRFEYERIRMYGNSALVNADAIVKGTERGQDSSGMYAATIMFVETPSGWQVASGQFSMPMRLPTPHREVEPLGLPSNTNAAPAPGNTTSNSNLNR